MSDNLKEQIDSLEEDRDAWKARAEKAEGHLVNAEHKTDELVKILRDLRVRCDSESDRANRLQEANSELRRCIEADDFRERAIQADRDRLREALREIKKFRLQVGYDAEHSRIISACDEALAASEGKAK